MSPAEVAESEMAEEGGGTRHPTGILPYQTIRAMIRSGEIAADETILEPQIQPASIDLRLGDVAYRVRASFLPGPDSTVRDKVERFGMHAIDLTKGAVLEKDCVYIVPVMERLALSRTISGIANPKSSTGRLDVFTRLIADYATEFERVDRGYQGPLYVEISPRAFSVVVRAGSRLNQLRFRRGSPSHSDAAIRRLHERVGLIDRVLDPEKVANGLPLTVDLEGVKGADLIGYKAKTHTGLIDVDRAGQYPADEYWEPIPVSKDRGIILNPGDFYILASKEAVTVPPDHAAEMLAYDTTVGEFRAHYAGFFDPGFGFAATGGSGTRAVLEVRSHSVPFLVEDGQVVGRLVYERMTDVPDKLYGAGIGSNYQRQGLALSKHFVIGGDS